MKIFKTLLITLLTIALAVSFVFSCFASARQNTSGSYSTAATITEKSRAWILEQFGDCETLPQLLGEIDRFVCANFVYDAPPIILVQHFNLDKFIFEDNFHGICFDFCCFVKCVTLVWSEAKDRPDVESYVYGVLLPNGGRHAYSYIFEDGHTYFMCPTTNVSRTQAGKKSAGFMDITGETPRENLARYDETLLITY